MSVTKNTQVASKKEIKDSYKLSLNTLLDKCKETPRIERFIIIKSYYDEEISRIPFSEFLCSSNCKEDELKLILSRGECGYKDLVFNIKADEIYLDGNKIKFYEECGDLVIQTITPCHVTTFEIGKSNYVTKYCK